MFLTNTFGLIIAKNDMKTFYVL